MGGEKGSLEVLGNLIFLVQDVGRTADPDSFFSKKSGKKKKLLFKNTSPENMMLGFWRDEFMFLTGKNMIFSRKSKMTKK